MPKLSIISVNLNNAEGLQKTIESVVSQTFTDYEYIIIDGGSTDRSVDIIQKYANKITYWVSEPDKGIYNGMNKGIKVAKGEYCQFLNSGDYLVDEKVLEKVFSLDFNEDIVYGNYIFSYEKKLIHKEIIDNLTFDFLLESSLPHTSTFIKMYLFKKYSYYNENYKIISDWEFFIRMIIVHRITFLHIKIYISVFDGNGISNDSEFRKLLLEEREQVKNDLFSPLILKSILEKKALVLKYEKFSKNIFIRIMKKIKLIDI